MKPSREPYGKCACAFTDGFTLTFPLRGGEQPGESHCVLRFDSEWFSHFAAQSPERSGLAAHPWSRVHGSR